VHVLLDRLKAEGAERPIVFMILSNNNKKKMEKKGRR